MKITGLDLTPIAARRETGFVSRHVIVRLEADDGTVGWGEMSDLGHLPAYLPDLPDLERTLRGWLLGRDPRALSALGAEARQWFPEAVYYYDMGSVIRAGLDIALHDLVARSLGVPVAQLLGGVTRDRFPVCYPIFRLTGLEQVEPNLERVAQRIGEGLDRFRLYVGRELEADLAFLRGFADRYGHVARIKSFDFSHLLDWKRSLWWLERLLAVCEPELVESPAPQLDHEGLREFRVRTSLPVSEHAFNTWQATDMLTRGSVDILNVCVTFIGGLGPARELAALARHHSVGVLIGTTQELSLGTAAQGHLGCALAHHTHPGDPTGPCLYLDDVTEQRVAYDGGRLVLPAGPGLGIEPEPALLALLTEPLAWSEARPEQTLDRTWLKP